MYIVVVGIQKADGDGDEIRMQPLQVCEAFPQCRNIDGRDDLAVDRNSLDTLNSSLEGNYL